MSLLSPEELSVLVDSLHFCERMEPGIFQDTFCPSLTSEDHTHRLFYGLGGDSSTTFAACIMWTNRTYKNKKRGAFGSPYLRDISIGIVQHHWNSRFPLEFLCLHHTHWRRPAKCIEQYITTQNLTAYGVHGYAALNANWVALAHACLDFVRYWVLYDTQGALWQRGADGVEGRNAAWRLHPDVHLRGSNFTRQLSLDNCAVLRNIMSTVTRNAVAAASNARFVDMGARDF